ncbi:MAG TPA: hypothetical protein PLA39_07165 [Methanoculleus sp.]|nr:hypothetical protein [Methanoculleus sp.]
MTDHTDRRGRRRRSGWDDIVQFEWIDFPDDIMQTGDDDLLTIDDQTRKVLDYLGHAPLEDIMRFEWIDFLEDPQAAAVIADEEVERPVRRQRGYHMRGTACNRRLSR